MKATCTSCRARSTIGCTSPTQKAARGCRDTLVAIGFAIEEEGVSDGDDDQLPFSLLVSRVDSIDKQSINGITLELVRLAGEHRGDYDGWGCEATREAG